MAKFGKWIGGGLGWAVGGPIGAIVGFVVGSVVDGSKGSGQTTFKGQGRTTTGGYVMSLLVLVASVMKADGKVLKSELEYVKKFLVQNFGENSAQEAIKMLRDLIKPKYSGNRCLFSNPPEHELLFPPTTNAFPIWYSKC